MIENIKLLLCNEDIKFIIRTRNGQNAKLIGSMVGLKCNQVRYIISLVKEPIKSEIEQQLFEKYKKYLSDKEISQEIIDNFNVDLKLNNF